MTEIQMFQPGKAFYDAYQQGRGNHLAGLAMNSQGEQRQSALAQLAGIDAGAAASMKKGLDDQDRAELAEFSNVILNVPDELKPQVYAKGVQRFGQKFRDLGIEPPADYTQAMPLFQQFAGGGQNQGVQSTFISGGRLNLVTRDGRTVGTGKVVDDSYQAIIDPVTGEVKGYAKRGNRLENTGVGGSPQPQAPSLDSGDPMQPKLERINYTVQAMKQAGVPVEQINAWADNAFAEAQKELSANGVTVQQAPQQAPQQARVSVKTEAPKPKEAPSGYQYNAAGTLEPIKGGPADPEVVKVGGEKLTDDMRKTSTLLSRMDFALNQIRDVEATDKSANRPGYGVAAIDYLPESIGNDLKSAGRQQIEAAQLDALDAALTLATGAAYTKEQLFGLRKAYFPQPNDSEVTIKAKQARFENVIQSARIRAGSAAQPPIKPPGVLGNKPVPPRNSKGWVLHTDKAGNRAYVSPDKKQFEAIP